MRQIVFIFLLGVLTTSYGQVTTSRKVAFYATTQSTLDKSKSPQRVQFGGNNRLLSAFLNQNLSDLKYDVTIDYNTTCEIAFRVDTLGNVDSIKLIQSTYLVGIDEKLKDVVQATSGKWRAGKIGRKKITEWNKIWIHLYKGDLNKKSLEEYIKEAENLTLQNKYDKALRSIDKALYYDELNTAATILKGNILLKLGRKIEACSLWQAFEQYKNEEVQDHFNKSCL